MVQLQALNEAVLHKYEKFSEPVHHILSFIFEADSQCNPPALVPVR